MKYFKVVVPMVYMFTLLGSCRTLVDSVVEPPKKTEPVKEENVELEAIDRGTSDPEADRTVYYKIFLNKELVLKTTPGLFFQKKTASLHLEPGRYLFFAERWYLADESEGETPEYKRANNVWQMKPVYLDVPEPPVSIKAVFGMDYDKSEFYLEIITVE